ncbi:MAG: 23S rRNA (adenine(2503)-C(2))-methyltransferase RlmN [Actinobacteria bacterium]|nr:23S rRNA (adenine(2503)-C(2))-methyltransferase RlmN [Actinomycetota bacterium]
MARTRRNRSGAGGPPRPAGAAAISSPLTAQEALTLYRPDLAELLTALSAPRFRYQQIYEHLMRRPGASLSACTVLPMEIRRTLASAANKETTVIRRADDGRAVTKLVLSLSDGLQVETVVMRYTDRVTVCVSTQVGCALGCTFCATGGMGFHRNLTVAEIIDQVRLAGALVTAEGRRVSNVVFMGMGEPLLNRRALFGAIRLLRDPRGLDLRSRGISVSTVGIPDGIVELAHREPQVNLALSLHATSNELRNRLIPANRKHPLQTILAATDTHFALTRRKLMVEYVLLRGVNDSVSHARALARLLRGRVAAVNLITWNEARGNFSPSQSNAVARFQDELRSLQVDVSIRISLGHSINAACGQLAAEQSPASAPPIDLWHDHGGRTF